MGSDGVTVEEIDRRLADWKQKLSLVGNNVMALTEEPTFKRLSAGQADLRGRTRELVAPALSAMGELWQNFALLGDVVNQAVAIRKNLPKLIGVQEKLQEIDRLLNGPSVKLPNVVTPLAARGLLTPAELTPAVTPERLLGAMTEAFETARGIVVQVDQAWDHLGTRLFDARQILDPSDTAIRTRLDELKAQLDTDPLGSLQAFDRDIPPLLEQARQTRREREAVRLDIKTCRQSCQDLKALHERANAAWSRCLEVIDQPPALPRQDASLLASLQQRLDNMETHLADGSWTPSQIARGLEAWHTQSGAFRDAEQKAADSWEALLAEREELRGLLAAYKHRAEKRGQVEDALLIKVGNEAEQMLHSPNKAPLKQARDLVDRYRQRIAELSGG